MNVTVPALQNVQLPGSGSLRSQPSHAREPSRGSVQVVDGENGVRAHDLHRFTLPPGDASAIPNTSTIQEPACRRRPFSRLWMAFVFSYRLMNSLSNAA